MPQVTQSVQEPLTEDLHEFYTLWWRCKMPSGNLSWLRGTGNVLVWSSQLSAANRVVTSSKQLQPVATNKNVGLQGRDDVGILLWGSQPVSGLSYTNPSRGGHPTSRLQDVDEELNEEHNGRDHAVPRLSQSLPRSGSAGSKHGFTATQPLSGPRASACVVQLFFPGGLF